MDFLPDATLQITGGWLTENAARDLAEKIAAQHNAFIEARAAMEDTPVTIDAGGIADATIKGTWQTVRLRSSVEGESISIANDVIEKALPLLNRFGRTGYLHTTPVLDTGTQLAVTFFTDFLQAADLPQCVILISLLASHEGRIALRDGMLVSLHGDTAVPYAEGPDGLRLILQSGEYSLDLADSV